MNEALQVARFVVWDLIAPAAIDHAGPLEGEHSHGLMVALSRHALIFIEGARPGREPDGMSREFVERLQEKRGTRPSAVDHFGLSAL